MRKNKNTGKKGLAMLGYVLVLIMALGMMALVVPIFRDSVSDSSEQVAEEMEGTMNTVNNDVVQFLAED